MFLYITRKEWKEVEKSECKIKRKWLLEYLN